MKKTDKILLSTALILGVLVLAGLAVLRTFQSGQPPKAVATKQTTKTTSQKEPTAATPTKQNKPAAPIPAYQGGESLKALMPTLPPEMFTGTVRAAYAVAREIPETLAEVPCYCHCDRSIGHKSLHTCFTDEHGANCGTCMNEAFMAYKLQKEQKLSPAQIREKIIAEYAPKQ